MAQAHLAVEPKIKDQLEIIKRRHRCKGINELMNLMLGIYRKAFNGPQDIFFYDYREILNQTNLYNVFDRWGADFLKNVPHILAGSDDGRIGILSSFIKQIKEDQKKKKK